MKKIIVLSGLSFVGILLILGFWLFSQNDVGAPFVTDSKPNTNVLELPVMGISFELPNDFEPEDFVDDSLSGSAYFNGIYITYVDDVRDQYNYESYHSFFGIENSFADASVENTGLVDVVKMKKVGQYMTAFINGGEYIYGLDHLEIFDETNSRIYIFEFKDNLDSESLSKLILKSFKVIPKKDQIVADSVVIDAVYEGQNFVCESAPDEPYDKPIHPIQSLVDLPYSEKVDVHLQKLLINPDPFYLIQVDDPGYLSLDHIMSYCANGKYLLLKGPRSYCQIGRVLRYDIEKDIIESADESLYVQKSGRCMSLGAFEGQYKSVIEMTGNFGDAGLAAEGEVWYDFERNVLDVKRLCTTEYNMMDENAPPKVTCEEFN